MKTQYSSLRSFRSKYARELAIILLLVLGTLISAALVVIRIAYSGSGSSGGLLKNLLLAWVPFLLAGLVSVLPWPRKWFWWVAMPCALLWLLFFPNAPYILTDFRHLGGRIDGFPVWYDVTLVLWVAWNGLMLGMLSLHLMQRIVTRSFGQVRGWVFCLVASLLGSFGIAMGLIPRLNSWDVIRNPVPILYSVLNWLIHPFSNLQIYAFTLIYTLLFLFVYLLLVTFGHLAARDKA